MTIAGTGSSGNRRASSLMRVASVLMRPERRPEGVWCELCGDGTANLAVCDQCVAAALSIAEAGGIDSVESRYDARFVRRMAEVCYLCGSGPPEHVDHVLPRSQGGTDHWSNVGAACANCNLRKGGRVVSLTEVQAQRLATQHATIRAAAEGLTDAVWWQLVESDIEYFFEDNADDLDLIDEEWVREEVEDSWFYGYASVPRHVVEKVIAYVVATAQVGGPTEPRATPRAQRIGVWDLKSRLKRALGRRLSG